MKKFDQLSSEQKLKMMDRFIIKSTRKLYNGGVNADPDVRKSVKDLVKETEDRYFGDAGGGSFCGCTSCLTYLVRVIKDSKFGRVKEIILADAQQSAKNAIYVEPDDEIETL